MVIDKPDGRFSFETAYEIDLGQSDPSVRLNDLEFNLAELVMQLPGGGPPLLELSRLGIMVPLVDVTHQTVAIETILFDGGRSIVAIDENGRLNWSKIAAEYGGNDNPPAQEAPEPSVNTPQEKPEEAWKIQVAGVELRDIQFNYQDLSRSPILHAGATHINGKFQLALLSGSAGTDLQVKDVSFGLNDIQIGNAQSSVPEICIENWLLKGGDFNLGSNSLVIESIFFQDGNIDVRREKDGRLNLAGLFLPGNTDAEKTQDPPDNSEVSLFHFLIRDVELSDFGIFFSDRTVKPDGEIVHLDNLHVAASNIDGESQMPVDLSFDIREGGRVEIQGRIDPLEPSVQADIDIASLSLASFEPYLKSQASLQVASGTLSTRGRFAYREKETQPKIAYEGDVDVADLQIMEAGSEKTLLGWKHFLTSDLKFRNWTAPLSGCRRTGAPVPRFK
jgi:uncharacterized protein involved in outer membrane biogenesis